MNRRSFHIGPGAASLMLIVVVLCMSVLGVLAVMNARSDLQLTERSIEVAESGARMNAAAERTFAELDGIVAGLTGMDEAEALAALAEQLPEGVTLEGRILSWQQDSEDSRRLYCSAVWNGPDAFPRLEWTEYRILSKTEETETEIWN